jgi:hypothetical protein
MRFQKSQPAGAATLVPPSASTGPLKNMDASSPARKAHAHEMHEKGSRQVTALDYKSAKTSDEVPIPRCPYAKHP